MKGHTKKTDETRPQIASGHLRNITCICISATFMQLSNVYQGKFCKSHHHIPVHCEEVYSVTLSLRGFLTVGLFNSSDLCKTTSQRQLQQARSSYVYVTYADVSAGVR